MHATLKFACVISIMCVVATALAAVNVIGVLSIIVNHCKSRSAPVQRLHAAERACAFQPFV